MNDRFYCDKCLCKFSSDQRLQSHLKRKLPCKPVQAVTVQDQLIHTFEVEPYVVQPYVVQPYVVQPYVVQPSAVQPSAVQTPIVQPSAVQTTMVQPSVVQTPIVQPSAVQISVAQPVVVQASVVQTDAVQTSMFTVKEQKEYNCDFCKKAYTRKGKCDKHMKLCNMKEIKTIMQTELDKFAERVLSELKETAIVKNTNITNNNVLQVVCVGDRDNYLDMLTQRWDFDRALCFVKDCALASLSGDCQLIEKIYLNEENPSIFYADNKKTNLAYFDENKRKVIDHKGLLLAKKLANGLQNSYLKGINHLINDTLDRKLCPNKFLEEYDIQIWNQHIFQLSDLAYQKKMMSRIQFKVKECSDSE
jgi:hypothetical protein